MSAAAASLAYLHGLETIIIVGVVGLLACVIFAFILAFILRSFLHRRQQATTPEIERRERNI
jgi:Na+/proline symporter